MTVLSEKESGNVKIRLKTGGADSHRSPLNDGRITEPVRSRSKTSTRLDPNSIVASAPVPTTRIHKERGRQIDC